MPHMEEAPYNNEDYGSYNPSFSFPDKPDVYTYRDRSTSQGPVPSRMTAASDTSFIPTESPQSPVIFNNNVFTPTRSSSTSPTITMATVDGSPSPAAQDTAPPQDIPNSLTPAHDAMLDPTQHNTSSSPATHDATNTSPVTCAYPETTQTTIHDDLADPVTSPSSQSSIPCSQTRIASAEIDKPFRKPRVKTPPYSPLLSSSLSKSMSTPPPTPEYAPLKAKLVQIDTSPLDTPSVTPERTTTTPHTELDQPSTSLDQIDEPEHPGADASGSSQDRRASTNSRTTQDGCRVGDKDDEGVLGDPDKNSEAEDDDELESDEEELLRVMARCNPIFITFSK